MNEISYTEAREFAGLDEPQRLGESASMPLLDYDFFSKKLWCDLSSNAERMEFIRCGRAHETGIISHAMESELEMFFYDLCRMTDIYESIIDDNIKAFDDDGVCVGYAITNQTMSSIGDVFEKYMRTK